MAEDSPKLDPAGVVHDPQADEEAMRTKPVEKKPDVPYELPWGRLYLTLLGAVISAVGLLAALSQITGYSAYTGEELPWHIAERLENQERERERDREARKHEPPRPEPSITTHENYDLYEQCVATTGLSKDDCAEQWLR
jgi:hypothetical protein